jgi:hypothetical protein
LRFLLEKGADASARDSDGSSLLYRPLVYHRSPRIVQMLVGHRVDVNALAPIQRMHDEENNHPAMGVIFKERAWYRVLHKGRYAKEGHRKESVKDWGPENKTMMQILAGASARIDGRGSNGVPLKAVPL